MIPRINNINRPTRPRRRNSLPPTTSLHHHHHHHYNHAVSSHDIKRIAYKKSSRLSTSKKHHVKSKPSSNGATTGSDLSRTKQFIGIKSNYSTSSKIHKRSRSKSHSRRPRSHPHPHHHRPSTPIPSLHTPISRSKISNRHHHSSPSSTSPLEAKATNDYPTYIQQLRHRAFAELSRQIHDYNLSFVRKMQYLESQQQSVLVVSEHEVESIGNPGGLYTITEEGEDEEEDVEESDDDILVVAFGSHEQVSGFGQASNSSSQDMDFINDAIQEDEDENEDHGDGMKELLEMCRMVELNDYSAVLEYEDSLYLNADDEEYEGDYDDTFMIIEDSTTA